MARRAIIAAGLMGMLALCQGCQSLRWQGAEPGSKAIAILNAGAVDDATLTRVRVFAETQLGVPVRSATTREFAADVEYLHQHKETALERKGEDDVLLIALVTTEDAVGSHLAVALEEGVALVNVSALANEDAETHARRIERQVMRGATFLFGLQPSRDPFCVTRDYSTLEELDRMGRNLFPPWKDRFLLRAKEEGLESPVQGAGMRSAVRKSSSR